MSNFCNIPPSDAQEFDVLNAESTVSINFDDSPAQHIDMAGNVHLELTNGLSGQAYVIRVENGGSFTMSFDSNILWPSGTAPTITTGDGSIDLLNFYYDGTNFYGSFAQDYQ
jgi:hypothetical protein